MNVVLHACCGPCASACVPRLQELGHEVTLLFANSNIDTKEEFDRRKAEAKRLAEHDGVAFASLEYDHDEWLREVALGYELEPEKGARCERCFRYNLSKAAEFAAEHGIAGFTTSLTVSPHKVSRLVFAAGKAVEVGKTCFLAEDFKKREGFKLSVRRAEELGLYRQAYCGCEFSKSAFGGWRLIRFKETASTNADARQGAHGDVFVADYQTAGRGRLDHKWLSSPGTNLMMSAVLSAEGLDVEAASTFPLVVGLAVCKAIENLVEGKVALKWPNDVWIDGKKVAGILCERHGDNLIAGIGINVKERKFPAEIAAKATSLALSGSAVDVDAVLAAVLRKLGAWYGQWRRNGFAAIYPSLAEFDVVKGRRVSVRQTDDDGLPMVGVSAGIRPDGSLDVAGKPVYAGEAHVEEIQ